MKFDVSGLILFTILSTELSTEDAPLDCGICSLPDCEGVAVLLSAPVACAELAQSPTNLPAKPPKAKPTPYLPNDDRTFLRRASCLSVLTSLRLSTDTLTAYSITSSIFMLATTFSNEGSIVSRRASAMRSSPRCSSKTACFVAPATPNSVTIPTAVVIGHPAKVAVVAPTAKPVPPNFSH